MRSSVLIIILLTGIHVYSQGLSLSDTLNIKFQEGLAELYTSRIKQQSLNFNKEISDWGVQREMKKMYKEINSDFFNTIEEGVFFENENYQLLFDNILSDIQEANIDFPQIKNTKI